MTEPTRYGLTDGAARILESFEVQFDGDAVTLVCRRCGAALHFSQGYVVAEMATAGSEHVLTECLGNGQSRTGMIE